MKLSTFILVWLSFVLFLALSAFGQTGITNTVGPGGDYSALASWEAALQDDLVTSNVFSVAVIQGDWAAAPDTNAVTIDGWTTDADHYILIYAEGAARHSGTFDASKYVLKITGNTSCLTVSEGSVQVIGLQFQRLTVTSTSGTIAFSLGNPTNTLLDSCLVQSSYAGAVADCPIRITASDAGGTIRNCAMFGMATGSTGSAGALLGGGDWVLMNCTSYGVAGSSRGYRQTAGTANTTNCIAQNCGDGWNGTIGGDYNISDIAADAPGGNSKQATITFTDTANGDFHTSDADSVDAGVDLSSDFTVDFELDARSGSWDIGADEYIAPAGGGAATNTNWWLFRGFRL